MPTGCAAPSMISPGALQLLDVAVSAAVEQAPLATPPASPAVGACYIVAASPTGAWAGRTHNLAAYTSGGWRFLAPLEGMTAYVRSSSVWAAFRSGAWELGVVRGSTLVLAGQQVVGARGAAIPDPAGGATVDAEARSAIAQILNAIRQHGLVEI